MRIWPGSPYPLGATWDGEGVNFALFSENATAVELCLFGTTGQPSGDAPHSDRRMHRLRLARLPARGTARAASMATASMARTSRRPAIRFNPAKVLIDPYAKAIAGNIDWSDALFGYRIGDPKADLSLDDRDNAGFIPKCVVVDQAFTWGGDQLLRTRVGSDGDLRSCMCTDLPRDIRMSPRTCAAPMPDSRRRP